MKIKNKKAIAILSIIVISASIIGTGFASYALEEKAESNISISAGIEEYTDFINFGEIETFAFSEYGVVADEIFQSYGSINFEFIVNLNANKGLNSVYSDFVRVDLDINITSTNSSINLLTYSNSSNIGTFYYGYSSYEDISNSTSIEATISDATLSTSLSINIEESYKDSDYVYCNLELNFDFSSTSFETDVYNNLITDGGIYFNFVIGVSVVYEE